ncbi:hypothetical protein [Ruegeria arenilitoris]|uniref:hypothetical protein n=1 Tax=Ruegeria arenilitoris TaxID=1173585 RepID=UPI00147E7C48|nr:hypothetical protein [Ruegeria arenilitoris]
MRFSFWTQNGVYWDYGLKEDEIRSNSASGDGAEDDPGDLVLLDNNLFQYGRVHYSGTHKRCVYLGI